MRKNVPLTRSLSPLPRATKFRHVSALIFVFAFLPFFCFSQAQLLVDANAAEAQTQNEYQAFCIAGGNLFFKSRGIELWRTTGTTGGTSKLKTFNSIGSMVGSGSVLYFFADDGVHGKELWKSNGTASGTVMVKDLTPGAASSDLANIVVSPTGVYFVATTTSGQEVWKSNGTASGTVIVKDIVAGGGSSYPSGLTVSNGILFFAANDGVNGQELWRSDGTAAGTFMVKNIQPASGASSFPQQLIDVNGVVYFSAFLPDTGRELWKSDGSEAGTVLIKNIATGSMNSGIDNLINASGALFFTATDGIHGRELWKSNGTTSGTVMVKDITPGPDGSEGDEEYDYFAEPMRNFYTANGKVYFTAYEGAEFNIWESDGTAAGTVAIQRVHRQGFNFSMPAFARISNTIYYFNLSYDPETGEDFYVLWKLAPGTITPTAVMNFSMGDDPYYGASLEQQMITFNNTLFFNRISGNGYRLFKSHGTKETTSIVKDAYYETLDSNPEFFSPNGGLMYFTAAGTQEDVVSGNQSRLWKTDGTPAGTSVLYYGQSIQTLPSIRNTTFFTDYTGDFNLWKTDGTVAGTRIVDESIQARFVEHAIAVNDLLFLGTFDGKLWRSDGTATGTFQIKAVNNFDRFFAAGNLMYFIAINSSYQRELWRSNGTASGTFRILSNFSSGFPWARQSTAELNDIVYFLGEAGTHGVEIWRSDGTTAGTYMFADLNASDNNYMGAYSFDIASLFTYKNNLYISALDNDGKWKLYRSDGVSAPQPITEFFPVSRMIDGGDKMYLFSTDSHTYPQAITQRVYLWAMDSETGVFEQLSDEAFWYGTAMTVVDGNLYFGSTKGELWRSDGTACGTFAVNTGVLGVGSLKSMNNKLFFGATKEGVGYEPFAYDLAYAPTSPCEAEMATTALAAKGGEEENKEAIFKTYPNPFVSDFALDVTGDGEEPVTIRVFTASGFPVETIANATATVNLGQSWLPGMYIVKVAKGEKVSTRMVVKK